ncbi:hypothetical protein [Gracilibacillus xinjiangensis]|uniref:ABC-2 type transport system permease protein n=1 Tax=Gracilibacillus xinjiangensis TaxID=1193282 RepID=A0ABV8WT05_9BACI
MRRTLQLVRFIRKSRRRKKQQLYKLAFGVALDRTISIYLSCFVFIGLFIIYDELKKLQQWVFEWETIIEPYMPILIVGLFMRAIISSFFHPGILFTSAEYKMTTLPYIKKHVWFVTFIESIAKNVFLYIFIFLSILLLTPISTLILFKWISIAMVVTLLLILPQWYLFQANPWRKVIVFVVGMICFALIHFLLSAIFVPEYFISTTIIILIVFNLWLWKNHLTKVDWMRVIEVNDTKVWNMFFVNRMSGMDIKPVKKPLLQQLFRSAKEKKPFSYQHGTVIFRKLWKVSLSEEKEHFIRAMITIIVCLVVLSFQTEWLQCFSIIIAIFAFNKITVSYFHAGFKQKIIHSIPWNMDVIKRAFLYWIYPLQGLLGIILICILLYQEGFNALTFIRLVHYFLTAYVLLNLDLNISVNKINQKWYTPPLSTRLIGPLSYLTILGSFITPFASVYIVFLIIYLFYIKKAKYVKT